MQHDIETAKGLGAAGVVLGVLTARGEVDRERTARLVDDARPLNVTFHKAFDAAKEPLAALEDLIALGVDRVLTSGAAASARDGLDLLEALTRQAAGRIVIMAGGGITEADIPHLMQRGVREVHIGSAAATGGMPDPEKVRRLVVRARSSHS
jgi:copper homeostasis protein